MSLRMYLSIIIFAALAKAIMPLESTPLIHQTPFSMCPEEIPESCGGTTPLLDSCCYEDPSGVLILTQFWHYDPATGPSDRFTLHGLWSDHCDGTYDLFCNSLLNVVGGNIGNIVGEQHNDQALLQKMNDSWKNFNGTDELLWELEYNKHGTCINTNRPECYGNGHTPDEHIYNYFKIAVALDERYSSYRFLEAAGIVPSETNTYTSAQISEALRSNYDGHSVSIKCDNNSALQEIWFFHHFKGPLISQNFVKIDSLSPSNCPSDGVKYLPKNFNVSTINEAGPCASIKS